MKYDIKNGPFKPTFESLRTFSCPQWFSDAKLGIWSHWGPQSVPMYGDWYARNMYIEGHEQYLYHIRHYGHPSKFGYKDIVEMWHAENFDPEELMQLYKNAGAKYFVAQAMHHDHFFNYASKIHRFNSVDVGPHKDIVGLWQAAAKKYGLPFGVTEHMGATFSWWRTNKGSDRQGPYTGVPYDGNNKAYEDFYLANQEHYNPAEYGPDGPPFFPWYTTNEEWYERWFSVMKELIDMYKPDLLYTDGNLPFDKGDYTPGLSMVAHLYNTSAAEHGQNIAVYNQKDRNREIYSVGILDIERSQEPDIKPEPWQTDTCVGHWFYDVRAKYKKPGHVIEMFIDIVAKNGNLLLNIPQKPDGTLDEECRYLLREMATWNEICGEGIFGTKPFRISGEGDSKVVIEGFREDAIEWNASDFRFTQKGNTLYAFMMRIPENRRCVIKSLAGKEAAKSVRLLGYGSVEFEQPYGTLVVKLPDKMPTEYVNCLAIEL